MLAPVFQDLILIDPADEVSVETALNLYGRPVLKVRSQPQP